jgi:adhesin transport system membrane fusion protein
MPDDVMRGDSSMAKHELALFDARSAEQAAKRSVMREQLAQRAGDLAGFRSQVIKLTEQLALVERELGISAPLVKRGLVSEVELLRLERERNRTRAELEQAQLSIPRAQAAIDEIRGKVADLDASFRAQAGAELSKAQEELAKASEQLPALKDRAERTLVRAPMSGVVKLIANRTIGGVVQPGSTIAEMVPSNDALLIEAYVRPADIAFVREGQRAIVKLTAYDFSIFGGVDGNIVYVSADSMPPQQPDAEPYFVAHVRTKSDAIEYHGERLPIAPGMVASVDVITGKHSILHYLLKPINRARERALTER